MRIGLVRGAPAVREIVLGNRGVRGKNIIGAGTAGATELPEHERDQHHDLKRAADLFSKALAVHPQLDDFNASQHNNLAAVYGDEEKYPAAIAELQQAIRILPTDPEFHINLASALAATGRYDQARTEAATALRIAPDDPNARDMLDRLNQIK